MGYATGVHLNRNGESINRSDRGLGVDVCKIDVKWNIAGFFI